MSVYREQLEKQALLTVSADLYYDLADAIGETTDAELYAIIDADGDADRELELLGFELER